MKSENFAEELLRQGIQSRRQIPLLSKGYKFRQLLAALIMLLVLFLGYIYFRQLNSQPEEEVSTTTLGETTDTITTVSYPSCTSSFEFFTVSPISNDAIKEIKPLGEYNLPSQFKPTQYLNLLPQSANTSVLSPTRMWITKISVDETTTSENIVYAYTLDFQICNQIRGELSGLTKLSTNLEELIKEPFINTSNNVEYRHYEKSTNEEINPNIPIGETDEFGLKLTIFDQRKDPQFIANPQRWDTDTPYLACPLDYFTTEMKSQLSENIIASINAITSSDSCGQYFQDVEDTAQGTWFLQPLDPQSIPQDGLTLASYKDVQLMVIKSPDPDLITSDVYSYPISDSGQVNRPFRDIKANSGMYCYEPTDLNGNRISNKIILAEITDGGLLKFEPQDYEVCGQGPWGFTEKVLILER